MSTMNVDMKRALYLVSEVVKEISIKLKKLGTNGESKNWPGLKNLSKYLGNELDNIPSELIKEGASTYEMYVNFVKFLNYLKESFDRLSTQNANRHEIDGLVNGRLSNIIKHLSGSDSITAEREKYFVDDLIAIFNNWALADKPKKKSPEDRMLDRLEQFRKQENVDSSESKPPVVFLVEKVESKPNRYAGSKKHLEDMKPMEATRECADRGGKKFVCLKEYYWSFRLLGSSCYVKNDTATIASAAAAFLQGIKPKKGGKSMFRSSPLGGCSAKEECQNSVTEIMDEVLGLRNSVEFPERYGRFINNAYSETVTLLRKQGLLSLEENYPSNNRMREFHSMILTHGLEMVSGNFIEPDEGAGGTTKTVKVPIPKKLLTPERVVGYLMLLCGDKEGLKGLSHNLGSKIRGFTESLKVCYVSPDIRYSEKIRKNLFKKLHIFVDELSLEEFESIREVTFSIDL